MIIDLLDYVVLVTGAVTIGLGCYALGWEYRGRNSAAAWDRQAKAFAAEHAPALLAGTMVIDLAERLAVVNQCVGPAENLKGTAWVVMHHKGRPYRLQPLAHSA
jgi:hypothetical protein